MNDDRIKKEERREFWGTSLPSLLACSGFFLGITGALLSVLHMAFISFCILGIAMDAIAIRMNLKKDLSIKWRKVNMAFHIIFLIAIIAALITVLWMKNKGIF